MPVSDRLVLLTRAVAVFAVNAVLGLLASAATLGTHVAAGTAQLTFAWLLPMTAAFALALAVAVAVRSAIAGAAAGVGAWLTVVLARSATASASGGLSITSLAAAVTDANLYLPYLVGRGLLRRDRAVRHPPPERPAVNIELTDVTRTFGRNKAVDGVSLAVGPGVFGLLGPNGAGKRRRCSACWPPCCRPRRARCGCSAATPAGRARTQIRRGLGYLPQNLGYYPSFTVAEFVEYFALLKEMPAHQMPKAVAAASVAGWASIHVTSSLVRRYHDRQEACSAADVMPWP
jgi:hypothetical protein